MLVAAIHQHESTLWFPLEPPFHLPSQSHPSRLSQSTVLSSPCHTANSHCLFILHMVMDMFPCCSLNSSILSCPHCVHKCSLGLLLYCCPTSRFISAIFLDFIHMCYHILFVFLTSLCMIGSRFIHLIKIDSNMLFLWPSNIPLYICTTISVSIHLWMDTHVS